MSKRIRMPRPPDAPPVKRRGPSKTTCEVCNAPAPRRNPCYYCETKLCNACRKEGIFGVYSDSLQSRWSVCSDCAGDKVKFPSIAHAIAFGCVLWGGPVKQVFRRADDMWVTTTSPRFITGGLYGEDPKAIWLDLRHQLQDVVDKYGEQIPQLRYLYAQFEEGECMPWNAPRELAPGNKRPTQPKVGYVYHDRGRCVTGGCGDVDRCPHKGGKPEWFDGSTGFDPNWEPGGNET